MASNGHSVAKTARKAPDELSQTTAATTEWRKRPSRAAGRRFPSSLHRLARASAFAVVPAFLLLAGCGGSVSGSSNGTFSISPGTATIDTNCTGCNNTNSSTGQPYEQFIAMLSSGGAASVNWSVSGGDANAGPGTITSNGQYTPPPYLTADSVQVTVTATLTSGSGSAVTAAVTVTPGFRSPLTPENVSLGSGGSVTITGYIDEAGGTTGINYVVSNSSTGSGGGQGTLANTNCTRSNNAFTYCTVTYTAPGTVSSSSSTYVVATIGTSSSKTATQVLLNTAGISSDPATHQVQLPTPILLGSSGGNDNDYDTTVQGGQTFITDCCGGTLGSLIQNSSGTQYLLSCNHVLARSDQASVNETIIQPGLIDDDCEPTNGDPAGTESLVGVLTTWLPLSSNSTNADAAIAAVNSGAVSLTGAIMELGTLQGNGTLAAAPPGTSSTGGKGENGSVGMTVAKSGRTTGLTCASISAINLDVDVSYYKDCGETEPSLTKTYTNQIAIEGNEFSDAGDPDHLWSMRPTRSPWVCSLPEGHTWAGRKSEGVADPVPDVLSELVLEQQQGSNHYTFVGTTDHPVVAWTTAPAHSLPQAVRSPAAQKHLPRRRSRRRACWSIHPRDSRRGRWQEQRSCRRTAVILYVDQGMNVSVPQTIDGVRTEVIPTTPQAVAAGTAPRSPLESGVSAVGIHVLNQAIAAKQQIAQSLMAQNPAFFGVGVGQSLDNPKEAALVIYVDRRQVPAMLPHHRWPAHPLHYHGPPARHALLSDRVRQSQGHCMAHPQSS